MPVINIEPTNEYKPPYDTSDEVAPTLLDQVAVLGNTAELQVAMGAPLEISEQDALREKQLLEAAIKSKKIDGFQRTNTAVAAAGFLREYGSQLALDVTLARSAITNKLMELANCGDPKFELKALELLGKHSDIGIFTNKSELTINYKNPEELEDAIKERVKRLLNADVIDVSPLTANLDEELGFAGEDEGQEEPDEEEEAEEDTEEDSYSDD